MGTSLAQILIKKNYEVYITTRSNKQDNNIHYIQGNAVLYDFIERVTTNKYYDCIVDFMDYETSVFKKNIKLLLSATKQYMFLSSSRVYADSKIPITEKNQRVLETCTDIDFMNTDEYPLHKAREEDILKDAIKFFKSTTYTIIRPYITYNTERLQLGTEEKEQWLWRALKNKTIVLPKSIAEKTTTLTYAYDVADIMMRLIGNRKAFNETFHIAGAKPIKWIEVLNIYLNTIEKVTGNKPKVLFYDDLESFMEELKCECQVKYDRIYNRVFDNSKVDDICNMSEYSCIEYINAPEGLESCMKTFISNPKWRHIDARVQAYFDRITKEKTKLFEFCSGKEKIKYVTYRYFHNLLRILKK